MMKKRMIAILMLTILCTACGSDSNNKSDSETTNPAFTATSYVVSPSRETVESETTKSQTETITITQKEIVADADFDFTSCEDAPILSGDTRELDWSLIFDENCIIIGEDRYPAYIQICNLGEHIDLETINIGRVSEDNPNELNDYYSIYYHGYKAGGIITSRKADVKPENAYVYTWTFSNSKRV